jgi:hypothetical protein
LRDGIEVANIIAPAPGDTVVVDLTPLLFAREQNIGVQVVLGAGSTGVIFLEVVVEFQGPRGPTGPTGATGATGPMGSNCAPVFQGFKTQINTQPPMFIPYGVSSDNSLVAGVTYPISRAPCTGTISNFYFDKEGDPAEGDISATLFVNDVAILAVTILTGTNSGTSFVVAAVTQGDKLEWRLQSTAPAEGDAIYTLNSLYCCVF